MIATNGFELINQDIWDNATGEFQLCGDDVIAFTGNSDQLTFMRGGEDTIIAYGNNQTIEEGLCGGNALYLLGHNTNLEFYESVGPATTMVYGGAQDGALVTLLAGEIAVEAPYRDGYQWGSQVTIHAAVNGSVLATADFAYDALVHIKTPTV